MKPLVALFEALGAEEVRTYVQSGNVVFSTTTSKQAELTGRIERMLRKTFSHYDATVALRSRAQMRSIVERAPDGFGSEPTRYRDDVIFLMPPLTARAVVQSVPIKEGVDRIWAGTRVVYFSRLTSRATQSRLSRIISLPIYQQMTIRNWNTTTKLAELVKAKAP
jgi:uncharacterized protein (DUF1697 family)